MASFGSIMQITATKLLRDLGSKCTITPQTGSKKSGYGVIVNAEAKNDISNNSGFITPADKVCYVQGNMGLVPMIGDTITFKTNIYTITSVMDITPDDVSRNTIVYKIGVRP
jgi:hypothetical protein